MFTKVKTPQEIIWMRESGQILATVLEASAKFAAVGMTTKEVADFAAAEIKSLGAIPAFLGQYGFPDVICISVNQAVVHGIPNKYVLKDGDVLSLDFGVKHNGMITDAARTVIVGTPNKAKQKLVDTTRVSLDAGIEVLKDGVLVGDIAHAVQGVLDAAGLGIVRDLVGHGVGHQLHEDPNIPNYGRAGTGPQLKAGMTIAIEPMATLGSYQVYTAQDDWTIETRDGSLAAHFEDTILITDGGYEILTRLK
jgi:methionyl aminopeptidase